MRKEWTLIARFVDKNEDEYLKEVGTFTSLDKLEEARSKDIDNPEFTGYYVERNF